MGDNPKLKHSFPKRFLWGAATAAHQVEGNNHNQWSVWELENAKAKAAQASFIYDHYDSWSRIASDAKRPENYVSGKATDHYNRYEEDFDLLKSMNMNAYRFSIEWSRIEPDEGTWNAEAIAHYKDELASLKKRGIEPIVTLFHFTLPVWFAEKGGFEKRSNVKYFSRFTEKILSELGSNVRLIITINEPEVYVLQSYLMQDWPPQGHRRLKALWVYNNLAHAHNKAAKIAHRMNRRYKVSIAKHTAYYYAGDDAWLSRLSARVSQYLSDDYFLRKVIRNCDFLGINYYRTFRIYGYRIHEDDRKVNDLQWYMAPADIQYVIEDVYQKYKKPIIVTENGLADALDENRKWWITETILALQKAMDNGAQVEGYLHWSLTDNFEWSFGKWPRFGLVEVDYQSGKRTLRPSAKWFGRVIKNIRGV